MNQSVHNAVRSDWIRVSNTLLLLLISIVVSITGWQFNRMANKQDAWILTQNTDHERVNTIQTAQSLLSKLVDQLRQDVSRHDYQIESIRQDMQYRDGKKPAASRK